MRTLATLLLLAAAAAAQTGTVERRVDPSRQVVVLVNETVADSVLLGRYYCQKRGVPEANILRVSCTDKEAISWPEFREKVLRPFVSFLERFPDALYVVPTWGVPSRITEENAENDAPKDQPDNTITKFVTNRDYACLDAELAMAPRPDHPIEGWIISDLFQKDEPITSAHRLLLVSRLDGPTVAIARGLVDKALYAETWGCEGRNYLDTRGLAAGTAYGVTDEEMRQTLKVFEKFGLALAHEDTETEQDVSTLEDCLHYWGWYAGDYNGTKPFRFRTGAVSAHLHSCSACSVRHETKYWVGPFLARGVTCTTGTVYEPLTAGFPRMHLVYDRLFQGYTWGEATAMGNQMLSWMAVFVGDPLYAPYAKGLKEVQERNRSLAKDGAAKAEALADAGDLDGAVRLLADIRAIGIPYEGAAAGDTGFLEREIASRRVAAAPGKVAEVARAVAEGDRAAAAGDPKAAAAAYEKALAASPASFDANLALGRLHAAAGKHASALPCLEKARKVLPDSPLLPEPLGLALAGTGKFREAIPHLEAARAAGAGEEALAALGDCHLKAGNTAMAVQVLTAAVRDNPRHRAATLALARAHESAKDWGMQMKVLADAAKIWPEAPEEVGAYKAVWKGLEAAAGRAGERKERERAALVLRDFEAAEFAPTTRGPWLEMGKTADELAGENGAAALGAIPSQELKTPGLPRVLAGNSGPGEVTILLHGPVSRSLKVRPQSGGGPPQGRLLGLIPGEYLVVVVVQSGRDRAVLTGRKLFEPDREYGMVVDANKALAFPPR